MAKIKVINPETGKKEAIKIKTQVKDQQYSPLTKIILWVIILILVVPIFVTAIWYLVGR